jgi:hypothetical protein
MKHCHFSIICNDLPFLKQKMDFLYKNFDQLIFYDLCIYCVPMSHSTDGTYEYLQNYPDPENKITIIDKTDINDVEGNNGKGGIEKQRMYRVGSSYVKDDIDVFWCSDMDEFCDAGLIDEAERILENPDVSVIHMDMKTFWKNMDTVIAPPDNSGKIKMPSRIARHIQGSVYGHCDIDSIGKVHNITNRSWLHFAWVGNKRVFEKRHHQPIPEESFFSWWKEIWNNENTTMWFIPNPDCADYRISKYDGEYPDYLNVDELWKDLNDDKYEGDKGLELLKQESKTVRGK